MKHLWKCIYNRKKSAPRGPGPGPGPVVPGPGPWGTFLLIVYVCSYEFHIFVTTCHIYFTLSSYCCHSYFQCFTCLSHLCHIIFTCISQYALILISYHVSYSFDIFFTFLHRSSFRLLNTFALSRSEQGRRPTVRPDPQTCPTLHASNDWQCRQGEAGTCHCVAEATLH